MIAANPKIKRALAKFDAYVNGVSDGSIIACKWVRLAVERHKRDEQQATDRGFYFDRQEAGEAICFMQSLKHSKGKWAGSFLVLEPWQCFIVGSIFGWKRTADGKRRFRISFCEIARKNGKSTIGAGVGIKLFAGDREPGAEVYSTASKRDQAKIVHEEAKRMVMSSPHLRPHVNITRDNLALGYSKYEPLGAAEDNLDGLNVSGAIIDELHQQKRGLFDVIDTGTGAREQPLLFCITTAGEGGKRESICWECHDYTQKVLEGIIEDDTWFGIIFALDVGDDWTDESVWPKANPNLGVSVRVDDLRAKVNKAKQSPASSPAIRQKHFNEWVGSVKAWLSPGLWQRNQGETCWYGPTPSTLTDAAIEYFRGRECYIALDLSSTRDLTAMVSAFPTDDDAVDVLGFGWCPHNNAIGAARDRRVPYLTYAEAGHMFLTETESVDYDEIRVTIRRARDEWEWDIREIAMDPYNASDVRNKLITVDGFDEDGQVFDHQQTCAKMNDPIKCTEKLLLDGRLRHGGQMLLAWCVSNVVVYTDSNANMKFDKSKSREKIDLAQAMVMAVGRAVANESISEGSVYETRGAIFI